MLAALVLTAVIQQAQPAPVVWNEPAAVSAPALPAVPAWALEDPLGYERAECSPLVRKTESLGACEARVRTTLAAHLGDGLPASMRGPALQECRQDEAPGSYQPICAPRERPGPTSPSPEMRSCETRPQARREGGMAWTEVCRDQNGREIKDPGIGFRIGGND